MQFVAVAQRGALCAVAIAVLALGLVRSGTAEAAGQPQARPAALAVSQATPLLCLGSRGPAVSALQTRLASLTFLPATGAVDGIFGMQTWHAVVAFQGWSWLTRDGVVGPLTQSALARASKPTPWSSLDGIEIRLWQQVMLLVRGGVVVRAIHVSTGASVTPTPVGHFSIYLRDPMSWSYQFHTWMPLAQYFYRGYAIHQYASVPAYPASHGCVRVPVQEARTVWNFGKVRMRVWTNRLPAAATASAVAATQATAFRGGCR
jgi:hypothetical protein